MSKALVYIKPYIELWEHMENEISWHGTHLCLDPSERESVNVSRIIHAQLTEAYNEIHVFIQLHDKLIKQSEAVFDYILTKGEQHPEVYTFQLSVLRSQMNDTEREYKNAHEKLKRFNLITQ